MTRRPLPSLRGLQAFEVFARTGAMTRAAAELSVTHGAVSRQIKALEAQLGARLVEGPKHQLRLTPAGRELASSLSSAFDMVALALPGAEAGQELVVACPGTFAMKWLIPRLPRFLHSRPGVRVRFVEDRAGDFSRGGVHAAITLQRGAAPAGLRATPFLDHAYGVVLSGEQFESLNQDRCKVLRLPRLHAETFASGWAMWAADMNLDLPEESAERSFEHNFYLIEAVAAGLGAAITAWAFVQADVLSGRLAAPWGFHPLASRFTYLRPAQADNTLAAEFGRWLQQEGRRDAKPPTTAAAAQPSLTDQNRAM